MTKPNYKTITWTIKDQDIIDILQPFCVYSSSPQGHVRSVLADAGIIRDKAKQMVSQVNSPRVELGEPFKLSLYTEDHVMLKAKAEECGLSVQLLLAEVLREAA